MGRVVSVSSSKIWNRGSILTMPPEEFLPTGPLRDHAGVAKFRHEAIAVVLRSNPKTGLSFLATKRQRAPFEGKLALPSGPMEVHETLEDAILRHLGAKAFLHSPTHIEQLATQSSPTRDPFDRTVATAYMVLVAWDQEWDLPTGVEWIEINGAEQTRPMPMAFDHASLVQLAVGRLRAKLSYTNLGYALAPKEFRISDLANSYAFILGHEVSATNLQRILSRRGQLRATEKKSAPGLEGGRPAKLFQFAQHSLVITDQFATLRP